MDLDEKKALVVVPGYIQQTIMMQNKEIVEEAISEVQERKISCEIVMESQLQKIRPMAAKKKAPAITGLNTTNLIQDYTFDNFVVGGSNRESPFRGASLRPTIPDSFSTRCSSTAIPA